MCFTLQLASAYVYILVTYIAKLKCSIFLFLFISQ